VLSSSVLSSSVTARGAVRAAFAPAATAAGSAAAGGISSWPGQANRSDSPRVPASAHAPFVFGFTGEAWGGWAHSSFLTPR
jgi:hypothetical protein